jgi:hypothetical protein
MMELVRPEARAVAAGSDARQPTWGIVDVILAILMLPFGIWMLVIDRMVAGMAWLFQGGKG